MLQVWTFKYKSKAKAPVKTHPARFHNLDGYVLAEDEPQAVEAVKQKLTAYGLSPDNFDKLKPICFALPAVIRNQQLEKQLSSAEWEQVLQNYEQFLTRSAQLVKVKQDEVSAREAKVQKDTLRVEKLCKQAMADIAEQREQITKSARLAAIVAEGLNRKAAYVNQLAGITAPPIIREETIQAAKSIADSNECFDSLFSQMF